jgi:hypothetical protein
MKALTGALDLLLQDFPESTGSYVIVHPWSKPVDIVTTTQTKHVAMADLIHNRLPNKSLPYGESKDAFHDLFEEPDNIKNEASFGVFRSILKLQEKDSPEEFEAFGQKIPTDTARRWGVFLILGIQFYFFVHLAEFRTKHFGNLNAAWIGAYTSFPARSLFFGTVFVAPVAVITFVCVKAGLLPHEMVKRNFSLCAVAVSISAFLAYLTARTYFRKERTSAAPAPPAAKAASS